MNKEPLVSVNILSFNRKNELRNTLKKVYEQDYKNIEVIVVDNASNDGSPEMVISEFPEVKLIKLKENIGITGWNEGFKQAKGEYVLVLDDDSYPSKNALEILCARIDSEGNTGIVAAKIINVYMNICETENYPDNPFSFVGCGALIDKKKLEDVGYFDKNLFIYLNELDLTARFIDRGFPVVYCDDAIIYHAQSIKSRGNTDNPFISDYRYENYFWGMSYFLLTKLSIFNGALFFTKWILNRFFIALFRGKLQLIIKCLFIFSRRLPIIISNRAELKKSTQKFYKYGNVFPLIDRDYFQNFRT